MSPLLFVGLLGLTMFLPIFLNDDEAEDVDPVTEGEDTSQDPGDLLPGTDGDDTLSATSNDTVDAGDGDDTLSLEAEATGATLNGQDGADTLTLSGEDNTGNGGLGQDRLIVSGSNTANGGDGDDTLTATDTEAVNDATLNGGGGDDLLVKDLGDTPGDLRVSMDGGMGNDRLEVELQLADTLGDGPTDVLTGGGMADTFALTLRGAADGDTDGGTTGQITSVEITDFDRTEDNLVLDVSALAPEGSTGEIDSTVLNASDDGSFTEVTFTFVGDSTPTTVRLVGVTGIAPDDISFV